MNTKSFTATSLSFIPIVFLGIAALLALLMLPACGGAGASSSQEGADEAQIKGLDLGKLVTQDGTETCKMIEQMQEGDMAGAKIYTNSDVMIAMDTDDALQTLLYQIQQGGSEGLSAARKLDEAFLLSFGIVRQASSGSDVNFLGSDPDDFFTLSDLQDGKTPSSAAFQRYCVSSKEPTFEDIDYLLSDYLSGAGCCMYSYDSAGSQTTDCYYRGDDWAGNASVFSSMNFEVDGTQYVFYSIALNIASSADRSGQYEHYSRTFYELAEGQTGSVTEDDFYYRPAETGE